MPRHRVLTPLRWSDMDIYGHVNNVQFLRIMEEARVIAFNEGVATGEDLASTGLIVARTEIEYLNPLLYRTAPIGVDLWVTRVGAVDFDMAYELLDPSAEAGPGHAAGAAGEIVYAHAETTLVTFDLGTQRPRRLSRADRDRLAAWQDAPVRWKRRRARPAGAGPGGPAGADGAVTRPAAPVT